MIKILLLLWIFTVAFSETYLQIPVERTAGVVNVNYIMKIEVNRYLYNFSITFSNKSEYFLDLKEIAINKDRVPRPQYRKENKDIFGIYEYTKVIICDSREGWLKFFKNLVYYLQNFWTKQSWINLQTVNQNKQTKSQSQIGEGLLAFSPFTQGGIYIKQFRKIGHNRNNQIVSIYKKNNERAILTVGDFPKNYMLKQKNIYISVITILKDIDRWGIGVTSCLLSDENEKYLNGKTLFHGDKIYLFQVLIDSKELILPLQSLQSLLQIIDASSNRCKSVKNNFIICENLQPSKYQRKTLNFVVQENEGVIQIAFSEFILAKNQSHIIFGIGFGSNKELKIGQFILNKYLIGLDFYRNKLLLSEKLSSVINIDRFLILKAFISVNLIILIISLGVVGYQIIHQNNDKIIKSEIKRPNLKSSGYEMTTSEQPIE